MHLTLIVLLVVVVLVALAECFVYLYLRRKLLSTGTDEQRGFDVLSLNLHVRLVYILVPVITAVLAFTGYNAVERMRDEVSERFEDALVKRINSLVSVRFIPGILVQGVQGDSRQLHINELVDVKGNRVPDRRGRIRYMFATADFGTPLIYKISEDSFAVNKFFAPDGKDSMIVELLIVDVDTSQLRTRALTKPLGVMGD